MLTEHLKNLEGLGLYPVISLVIFIFAFILIIIRTLTADKKYLQTMENLPLDLNGEENKNYGGK